MSEPTILRWGSGHHLEFHFFDPLNISLVILHVNKAWAQQKLMAYIPKDIVEGDVLEAWKGQGKDWVNLVPNKDAEPVFRAVRCIFFPQHEKCLLWHVLHIDDRPYDALCFVDMDSQMKQRIAEQFGRK